MKTLIFLLLIFISLSVSSWEIIEKNDETFLQDSQYKISTDIEALDKSVKPEVKELNDDLILLSYKSNEGGTKSVMVVFSCAIFSKKLKKFIIKDQLCKQITTSDNGKITVEEAKFEVGKDAINYSYQALKSNFPLK